MWLQTFFQKYKIHLLILFIATFIWIHVKTDMDFEQIYQVKVVAKNVNPEFVITNTFTRNIPVLFQGKGKSLIALHNTDVEILADFNQTTGKSFFVKLNLSDIRISPPLVNIVPVKFIKIDTIQFLQDNLRYKKVPIDHQITLKTKAGFIQVGPLKLSPKDVTVSGPISLTNEIKSVKTEELFRSDLESDVSGIIDLTNSFSGKVVLSTKTVEYKADIQTIIEIIMDDIPVHVTNVPENLKVSLVPSTLSLKIIGGVDVISSIERKDIYAYIEYQMFMSSDVTSFPAKIEIPENIIFSDVYPQTFQLKIK